MGYQPGWRWPRFWALAPATPPSSLRLRSWVSAPPCSTPNLRASRAWLPVGSTAWRNRFSRLAQCGLRLGPLLAAFVLTKGQSSLAVVFVSGFLRDCPAREIGTWTKHHKCIQQNPSPRSRESRRNPPAHAHAPLPTENRALSCHPVALMFSKFFYLAS